MVMTFNELQKAFSTAKVGSIIQKYNIGLIMVFGSVAKDSANTGSDIDLAVLINGPCGENQLKIRFRLIDFFEELFKKNCDLILLNDAPPQLKYQVFKYGQLLFEKGQIYNKTYTQTLREYFDFTFFADYYYTKVKESFLDEVNPYG